VHIGVKYLSQETNLRWLQWILLRYSKCELENTTLKRSFRWSLMKERITISFTWATAPLPRQLPPSAIQSHLDKSSPLKYVRVIANQLNVRISSLLSLHLFVFLEQPRPRCLQIQAHVDIRIHNQPGVIKKKAESNSSTYIIAGDQICCFMG